MVAYKAAQAAQFIKNPKPGMVAALVYGPDASHIAERARELCDGLAGNHEPPADILRLSERDLSENPERLAVELTTSSLFGEDRIVHLRSDARIDVARLEELLDGPLEAQLVIQAGNLRPSSPLRKLFEKHDTCAALPCYAEPGRDLRDVINTELEQANVRADRETLSYLQARLGTDMSIARSECRKLITYLGDDKELTVAAIDAAIGDVAGGLADAVATAVAEGKTALALQQLDALISAGQAPFTALSALNRHFQRLHRVCAAVETGETPKAAVSGFRPPLHFKLQDTLIANARTWSMAGAARALEQVNLAIKKTRLSSELECEMTERLVLALSPR